MIWDFLRNFGPREKRVPLMPLTYTLGDHGGSYCEPSPPPSYAIDFKYENKLSENQLFTGVFYDGYGPPGEFCWDARCTGSDPIVADPNLENYNVEKIYNDFVNYLLMRVRKLKIIDIACFTRIREEVFAV